MDTGGGNAGSSEAAKSNPSSSSETTQHSGCGYASGTTITVRVTPTTGGQFDLQVAKTESVENLKKLISKKLKVPKERICLLHRDRQLRDGTLHENQLMDGSRLTLLPSVETGLLAQRPEQSVMQALESLNDSQVNDFLSGKAPLNLTMRLGDHMMLIQLQLSTVTPSSSRRSATSSNTSSSTTTSSTSSSSVSSISSSSSTSTSSLQLHAPNTVPTHPTSTTPLSTLSNIVSTSTATGAQSSIDGKCSNSNSSMASSKCPNSSPAMQTCSKVNTSLSPISTSAAPTSPLLVSSRSSVISSTHTPVASSSSKNDGSRHPSQQQHKVPQASESSLSTSSSSTTGLKYSSPASLPTRPLTSLYSKSSSNLDSSQLAETSSSETQSPLKSLENATNNLSVFTARKSPESQTSTATQDKSSSSSTTAKSAQPSHTCNSQSSLSSSTAATSSSSSSSSVTTCKCEPTTTAKPTLDTRALAEASRNLTQTLKQLSSEVLTSRSDPAEDSARARRQGAIIESMHHHGKGVYSGTFSGTLNPALQDRFGRPKRDISTIIHILNDLLCATPQYRRHARQGHTITVEASSGSPAKTSSASTGSSVSTESRTGSTIDFMDDSATLSQENQATRGKMEHLRLIMEERRARRRARREARSAPYTLTQWSAKSESLTTQQNPAGGSGSGSLSHGDEPMDTAGDQHVCELNPPEPVVA